MKSNKITIAIDGYSSCGKSTLAKDLAKKLGYVFVDSGAMYRAVTYYAIQSGFIDQNSLNEKALIEQLDNINISFIANKNSGENDVILNGENVNEEIRSPKVSEYVSLIAKIKEVRTKLVDQQRLIGVKGGVVMDGRDIGSVVFPNAELKLFVTADIETRTTRRYNELINNGVNISKKEVEQNLIKRDQIDTSRSESPLVQTKDAIVVDNTNLTKEEQLKHVINLVNNNIYKD